MAVKTSDKEIAEIKKRLDKIEKELFSKKSGTKKQTSEKNDYSGLVGGIQLLIDKKFFSKPRQLSEVTKELKTNTYHYSLAVVSKSLARDFVKTKRILTRIKDGKKYSYVIRK